MVGSLRARINQSVDNATKRDGCNTRMLCGRNDKARSIASFMAVFLRYRSRRHFLIYTIILLYYISQPTICGHYSCGTEISDQIDLSHYGTIIQATTTTATSSTWLQYPNLHPKILDMTLPRQVVMPW
jgi:hypothetical protein